MKPKRKSMTLRKIFTKRYYMIIGCKVVNFLTQSSLAMIGTMMWYCGWILNKGGYRIPEKQGL